MAGIVDDSFARMSLRDQLATLENADTAARLGYLGQVIPPHANRAAGLSIDALTGLTKWTGDGPDYTMCADALWTRSRARAP